MDGRLEELFEILLALLWVLVREHRADRPASGRTVHPEDEDAVAGLQVELDRLEELHRLLLRAAVEIVYEDDQPPEGDAIAISFGPP